MKKINLPKELPLYSILFAETSEPDYEMSRTIILDPDNLPEEIYSQVDFKNIIIVIEGHHCSCYDFCETEFDAMGYTKEEFLKLCDGSYSNNSIWQKSKEYFYA